MLLKTTVFSSKSSSKRKSSKQANKNSSHKIDYTIQNTFLQNGKMVLYEDPIKTDRNAAFNYFDNMNSYDYHGSPPLLLRSYTSSQSSNPSSASRQQKYIEKENPNFLLDSSHKTSSDINSSVDYIQHIVEPNERRYEKQENNTTFGYQWQILSQIVDRLLVVVFLVSTILVFFLIFYQAPHLRLK